ncbi:MAG: hypothetical protein JST92_25535 [Deltaproteobacteria bacterium]|nr:hypothetical protein [Deltaproteobacteria bacterium]
MSRTSSLAAALVMFALAACGGAQPSGNVSDQDDVTAAKFVNLEDWASDNGLQGPYFDMRDALTSGFNQICGDTFCGSDYSNMQALSFRCSVEVKTGNIGQCFWIFAGSYEDIAKTTGGVTVHQMFKKCAMPVKGSAKTLITTLTAAGTTNAIRRVLPGSTQTAYDALGGCLP